MCISTNIPLERVSKMHKFFNNYCQKGGRIPSANQLRDHYLPLVTSHLRSKMLQFIEQCRQDNYYFSVNVDETCDERDNYIIHFILPIRKNCVLLESKTLNSPANHFSLGQIVNEKLVQLNISGQCLFYLTHNESSCQKSYSTVPKAVYPQLSWVGCGAHIVDLCAETWKGHFYSVSTLCKLIKMLFKKKLQQVAESYG